MHKHTSMKRDRWAVNDVFLNLKKDSIIDLSNPRLVYLVLLYAERLLFNIHKVFILGRLAFFFFNDGNFLRLA